MRGEAPPATPQHCTASRLLPLHPLCILAASCCASIASPLHPRCILFHPRCIPAASLLRLHCTLPASLLYAGPAASPSLHSCCALLPPTASLLHPHCIPSPPPHVLHCIHQSIFPEDFSRERGFAAPPLPALSVWTPRSPLHPHCVLIVSHCVSACAPPLHPDPHCTPLLHPTARVLHPQCIPHRTSCRSVCSLRSTALTLHPCRAPFLPQHSLPSCSSCRSQAGAAMSHCVLLSLHCTSLPPESACLHSHCPAVPPASLLHS